jgi:hypothetical protein
VSFSPFLCTCISCLMKQAVDDYRCCVFAVAGSTSFVSWVPLQFRNKTFSCNVSSCRNIDPSQGGILGFIMPQWLIIFQCIESGIHIRWTTWRFRKVTMFLTKFATLYPVVNIHRAFLACCCRQDKILCFLTFSMRY